MMPEILECYTYHQVSLEGLSGKEGSEMAKNEFGGDSSSMAYPNEYLFSSATISSFLKKKPSSCASFKRGKSIIKKSQIC